MSEGASVFEPYIVPSQPVSVRLGNVIKLPVPEQITEQFVDKLGVPTNDTDIDSQKIRKMLERRNSSTPTERIAHLLAYAWNTHGPVERPIPTYLLPYFTDEPSDIYNRQKARIEAMQAARRDSRSPRRYDYEFLFEETERFETIPFLRNAIRINRMAMKSEESMLVEISVRLALSDAEELRREDGL